MGNKDLEAERGEGRSFHNLWSVDHYIDNMSCLCAEGQTRAIFEVKKW